MSGIKIDRLLLGAVSLCSVLLVLGTVSAVNAQNRQERQLIARAESISGDRFNIRTSTPRGVRVYALSKPRAEILRAIDDGFTALFAVASRHGYRVRLGHSAYSVFIARADRTKDSSGGYSPDLAIPAGQYAGSDYDQGGFVYAAGMVVAYSPSALILSEHQGNMGRVSEIVRYEGEHILLYHNDRQLYERTKDHSQGGGHPILK